MSSDLFTGQAIILTVACGKPKYAKQAMALAMSVRLHGAKTPLVLLSDCADETVRKWFDAVISPVAGIGPYLQKVVGLQATGADRVLFLDSDSLAVRNLDPLLDKLSRTAFAATGDWITDGYYWGDTKANMAKIGATRIARMNGGLLFYERTPDGQAVIDRALAVNADYDRLGLDRLAGKIHDEGCVSPALSTTGKGTLIPDTEGYSLTPWTCSQIDIDVVRGTCTAIHGYRGEARRVEPWVYHSAMSGWDLRYWRQVRKLMMAVNKARSMKLHSGKQMTVIQRSSRKIAEGAATVYKKLFLRDH